MVLSEITDIDPLDLDWNVLHTFSNICPKESFAHHSFQQFIKAYRQKCVPHKIEYYMTFHHRILFGGVRVANLFIIIFL
jgi:hypothetical protein